jgi:hypothetical protein
VRILHAAHVSGKLTKDTEKRQHSSVQTVLLRSVLLLERSGVRNSSKTLSTLICPLKWYPKKPFCAGEKKAVLEASRFLSCPITSFFSWFLTCLSGRYEWRASSPNLPPVLAARGPTGNSSSSMGGRAHQRRCRRRSMRFIARLMPTSPPLSSQTLSCQLVCASFARVVRRSVSDVV